MPGGRNAPDERPSHGPAGLWCIDTTMPSANLMVSPAKRSPSHWTVAAVHVCASSRRVRLLRQTAAYERRDQVRAIGNQPVDAPVQQAPRVLGGIDRPHLNAKPGAMGIRDEPRRDHTGAARPLRHLIAVVADAGHRPPAPGSIQRPADFFSGGAGGDRRLDARGPRAALSGRTTRGRPDRPRPRREPRSPTARAISAVLTFNSTMIGTSRYRPNTSIRRGMPTPGRETESRPPARRRSRRRPGRVPRPSGRRSARAGSWSGRAGGRDARRPRRRGRDGRPAPGRRRRRPVRVSNAARVFSGASALPPRCANTSGRPGKERMRHGTMCVVVRCALARRNESDRIGPWPHSIQTLGDLRGQSDRMRPVKQEIRDNLVRKLQAGRAAVSGHHRLRRNRRPAADQRDSVAAQLHPARSARPGEESDPSRPHRSARRTDSGRARLRDSRQPAGAAVLVVPRPGGETRRQPGDRLAAARRALRREAGDA